MTHIRGKYSHHTMGRFKSEENIKTNTLPTDTESCDTKSDITAHICEIYIYIYTQSPFYITKLTLVLH